MDQKVVAGSSKSKLVIKKTRNKIIKSKAKTVISDNLKNLLPEED